MRRRRETTRRDDLLRAAVRERQGKSPVVLIGVSVLRYGSEVEGIPPE